MHLLSYQWGFVVAVKYVDEVSNRQHTCWHTRRKQASTRQHNYSLLLWKDAELLTNKALLLTVPEWSGSHPVRDKGKEGFLDLQQQQQGVTDVLHGGTGWSLLVSFSVLPEGTYRRQLIWNWWVRGRSTDETSWTWCRRCVQGLKEQNDAIRLD